MTYKFYCLLVALLLTSLTGIGQIYNGKPTDDSLSHYRYQYSIEELHRQFSDIMMEEARQELRELDSVNARGPFSGNLESIASHISPVWYQDAKLGIFYDWGLYSVAGYGEKGWSKAKYPDWYLGNMYRTYQDYHQQTWGEAFQRDDFIPYFTADSFDATGVVELVRLSGARYLVPFSKHHDGYCLWDSYYTQRDVKDMSPGRDLLAELIAACEAGGIRHGFYFSVEDYEYPVIDSSNALVIRYWSDNMAPDNAGMVHADDEYIGHFQSHIHNSMLSGKVPVRHFVDEYILPQAKDYIDRYDPDILWFDGEWQRPASYYRTPELVAYFYNRAAGRKEVVCNDRMGSETRGNYGDFFTSETDEVVDPMTEPWEENRSMSDSYGYCQTDSLESYLSADDLIQMLVRIVAKGGNLNLIVNPDGVGHISQEQVALLTELGNWLKINGEAIYETRPYETLCDNTQLGQPVWYTMNKDSTYAYAIVFDWPRGNTFICDQANIVWETDVYMLGYDQPLEWVDTGLTHWGMSAKIPEEMLNDPSRRPCQHAWVLKFVYDKNQKYGH